MILEAVQRPGLLGRVQTEIASFIVVPPDGGPPDIDQDGLCQKPLLQSMYAEVLRVHSATVLARFPASPDFPIAGWLFAKDEPIIVPSYDTAHEPTVTLPSGK